MRLRRRGKQAGFTYLWVLMAIAIIGIGLLAVSEVWLTTAQRQKTEELEWIGLQFTQAIGSYYQSTPGSAKHYPASMRDLLEDRRNAVVRRHLRTVYRNPFTGATDWELIKGPDGMVHGVRVSVPAADAERVREFLYAPSMAG